MQRATVSLLANSVNISQNTITKKACADAGHIEKSDRNFWNSTVISDSSRESNVMLALAFKWGVNYCSR